MIVDDDNPEGADPTSAPEVRRRLTPAQRDLWFSVVDGGWALMSSVTAAMTASGLAVTDLRIFDVLGDNEQLGISELAAELHMQVSTVSRQVSRLTAEGLVERVEYSRDGRHRLVRLTSRGLLMLDEHRRVRDEIVHERVIDVLTDEEFAALGAVFAKIGAALQD